MRNLDFIDQINIETAYLKGMLEMLAVHFEDDGQRLSNLSYANIAHAMNSHVENIERALNEEVERSKNGKK